MIDTKHPKGLYFLFFVEMWERFSYYGMRALLVLYMVKSLMLSTEKASNIYGLYTGLVYLTPLIGGYIADRYLGPRKCIFIGALLMMLGHFAMAISNISFFYCALGLLILGNGFFKSNISSIVGNLYEKDDPRRDGGFTIFYMGINIGAFLSPLMCGTLGEKFGFHYGFAAAGVGMLLGLLIYKLGENKYLKDSGLKPFQPQIVENNIKTALTTEEKHKIAVIFILMFFSIFFWMSFEQAGSSLTLFADRDINRMLPFFNKHIPVSWFQSINPLLIMFLAPVFSKMWIDLSQKGKEPDVVTKFILGLLLAAIGFVIAIFAALSVRSGQQASFMWLLGIYFFHTVGELCLSPVGLSAVTKLSPPGFASMLMGVWFLSSFFANLLAGSFAGKYDHLKTYEFFAIPVVILSISAFILFLLRNFVRKFIKE